MRALEKKEKGFEGADADDTQEVNALREMEKAKREVQEREEKKSLTQGASGDAAEPKMNIKVRSPHLNLPRLVYSVDCRVLRLARVLENVASSPVCLLKPTRTGRHWRRKLQKDAEIGRKQVINTVRFTDIQAGSACSHLWKGF